MVSRSVTVLVLCSTMVCGFTGEGFGTSVAKAGRTKKKKAATKRKENYVRPYSDRQLMGKLSQKRIVPEGIVRPDYAETGRPKSSFEESMKPSWMIEVKSEDDINKMRESGRLAREVLDITGQAVSAGVKTDELDRIAHEAIIERGAYPSPLNYHGFPKSICTSVNEVICHGIPDSMALSLGDIVNIDVTVYYNGFHGDCSEMFYVGSKKDIDQASQDLVQCTFDAWRAAIDFCKPGRAYKDIGGIIDDIITPRGYESARQFVGHGIGKTFHTSPNVLHYKNSESNGVMAPGHVFTIEPMICEGKEAGKFWKNEWTCTTKDLGRSAQFEHTLLITESGVEALTAKLPTSTIQPWEKSPEEDRLQFAGVPLL